MSPFEFVAGFYAIILGLAVAHLLGGISEAIENRRQIKFDWIQGTWVLNILLAQLHSWWGMWELGKAPAWNYGGFIVIVVYLAMLYLLSRLAFPRMDSGPTDLSDHFANVRASFMTFLAIILAMAVAINRVLFGEEIISRFTVLPAVVFVLCAAGAVTTRRAYHAFLAVCFTFFFVFLMISDVTTLK